MGKERRVAGRERKEGEERGGDTPWFLLIPPPAMKCCIKHCMGKIRICRCVQILQSVKVRIMLLLGVWSGLQRHVHIYGFVHLHGSSFLDLCKICYNSVEH